MRRRTRVTLAAALAGAVALSAAAPASAAPDPDDVVYLFTANPVEPLGFTLGFSAASTTDAAITPLPTAVDHDVIAIEVVGEHGYAMRPLWEGFVFTTRLESWSTTTGEVADSTLITIDEDALPFAPGWTLTDASFTGLDSADGTTLQTVLCLSVNYPDDSGASGCFLGTLDPGTAVFAATADLTSLRAVTGSSPKEIATDPISGATAVLYGGYNGMLDEYVSFVALVTDGTVGTPKRLAGVHDALGGGTAYSGDYAPDGTLWMGFTPIQTGELTLLSFAPGAVLDTATPSVAGSLQPSDPALPHVLYSPSALAAAPWVPAPDEDDSPGDGGPAVDPALADTGAASDGALAIALGLLVAGAATVLLARRRRTV